MISEAEPVETANIRDEDLDPKALKKAARKEATQKRQLRRVHKKPKKPKKRYWITLDPDSQTTAKQRVKEGYAPDDYLSPTINRLIDNWIAGHYDDVHEELGWFD